MASGETRTCPDCDEPMRLGRLIGYGSAHWQELPRGAGPLRALFTRSRKVDAWACEECGKVVLALRRTEENGPAGGQRRGGGVP